MGRGNRASSIAYWALVAFLIGFGFLGMLSIGMPFLLLGLWLAIVSRRRHETGVLATGVAAIFGFTLGYLLVVPLRCTTSVSSAHPVEHTVCSYIFGVDVSRPNINYYPNLSASLLVGLVVAAGFALGARWVTRRIAASRASERPTVG